MDYLTATFLIFVIEFINRKNQENHRSDKKKEVFDILVYMEKRRENIPLRMYRPVEKRIPTQHRHSTK